jgi:hypothetical protein
VGVASANDEAAGTGWARERISARAPSIDASPTASAGGGAEGWRLSCAGTESLFLERAFFGGPEHVSGHRTANTSSAQRESAGFRVREYNVSAPAWVETTIRGTAQEY